MALIGVLGLSCCAKNPVGESEDLVLMSEQQEVQQGAQAHKEVLAQYRELDSPALQACVTRVGKALAAKSHRPDLDWHFTVVDSPEVNAFALPGGYVYVTRGILAYLTSEAELAAVLGHEIGHVSARHALRQQSAATAAGPGPVLGPVLVPGFNSVVDATLLQKLAASRTAGYGPELELETDRLDSQYLAKAGYDPQAMVEVIGALKNQELFDAEQARQERREPRRYHGTFVTHPDNDARLKQVAGEADRYRVARPRVDTGEFMRAMNGVYFGDSPDQGAIRHNALLHEKLGIALQFPHAWQVQNHAERASAVNAQGDAIMELVPQPRNGHPLDNLQNDLTLDPGARYETGTVNALPARFAAGTQQGKPVLVAAISFNGSRFLVTGITKDGPAYQRNKDAIKAAISSFHAITAAERQQARPYAISVIAAQPGTSMAGLAARSPLGPHAETYLRLMNHLYPDAEPRPGQLLKVVN
jgi:predicted Zn-dependent protease